MTDFSDDIRSTSPSALAKMMTVHEQPKRTWRPEDLGAILKHQLATPVQVDLESLDPTVAPKVRTLSEARGLVLKSFGDLLLHPNPPVELLTLTKDFAKANRNNEESALPPEVATVLYFASIAAARLRCNERISRMDDAQLQDGLEWAGQQPWLDADTRTLIKECLDVLNDEETVRKGT